MSRVYFGRGDWREAVDPEPCVLKGLKGVDAFTNRTWDGKGFVVTHAPSGLALTPFNSSFETREKAAAAAVRYIRNHGGAEAVPRAVERWREHLRKQGWE